jgi:hypothetical protein
MEIAGDRAAAALNRLFFRNPMLHYPAGMKCHEYVMWAAQEGAERGSGSQVTSGSVSLPVAGNHPGVDLFAKL